MRIISKIKTKIRSFIISIVGLTLLLSLTTSCSSTTPPYVVISIDEDVELVNRTSQKMWRDRRESYLESVEKSLYEKESITNSIIESIKKQNGLMTVDKEMFLIQSCEHGNQQACEFMSSQPNQF